MCQAAIAKPLLAAGLSHKSNTMKEYIFTNTLNSNIEIKIKAYNYTQAMDLLLSVTRNIDDYRLMPDGNELSA
jgi:hypothetical protein